MLIYHPAYDAYHCIFRMLCVVDQLGEVEVEKARILDFYLVFPSAVAKIRLPAEHRVARADAKLQSNPYRDPINPTFAFRDMRHIQDSAVKCMAASNLVDIPRLEMGFLASTGLWPSQSLQQSVRAYPDSNPVFRYVLSGLADLPLRGVDGLKHRTQLMEHVYDAA